MPFSSFMSDMQNEKQFTPPIRVLFAGDDKKFNDFVHDYVENVLMIEAEILGIEDDSFGESTDDVFAEDQFG